MQNKDKYINVREFKELHTLSASHCHNSSDKYLSKILIWTIFKMAASTQRNLSKITRKLNIIQWFYSNIAHLRYT